MILLAAAAKGGGIGAVAVFALFVVAFLVLALMVFRFTKQVERRRAEQAASRRDAEDQPAP